MHRKYRKTPRTDERIIEICGKEYVTAAFAMQLEEELSARPEAAGKVLVSKELLRHAQRKCTDIAVQLAIHNILLGSE